MANNERLIGDTPEEVAARQVADAKRVLGRILELGSKNEMLNGISNQAEMATEQIREAAKSLPQSKAERLRAQAAEIDGFYDWYLKEIKSRSVNVPEEFRKRVEAIDGWAQIIEKK